MAAELCCSPGVEKRSRLLGRCGSFGGYGSEAAGEGFVAARLVASDAEILASLRMRTRLRSFASLRMTRSSGGALCSGGAVEPEVDWLFHRRRVEGQNDFAAFARGGVSRVQGVHHY